MGIIDAVRTGANPLWLWKEDPSVPLVLDLDEHRLCGVGIGDALEKLSFLGPGKVESGLVLFPAKGLQLIRGEDWTIEELAVFFGHADEPEAGAFPGTFKYRSSPCPLSRETTEDDVRKLFGEPYWRDDDEGEVILFYEWGPREWQGELARDGKLKCLVIGEPTLADPDQRAAYGVTKSWPPR